MPLVIFISNFMIVHNCFFMIWPFIKSFYNSLYEPHKRSAMLLFAYLLLVRYVTVELLEFCMVIPYNRPWIQLCKAITWIKMHSISLIRRLTKNYQAFSILAVQIMVFDTYIHRATKFVTSFKFLIKRLLFHI